MSETFKMRFDFSSPVIQAQAVRSLIATLLKEKGENGKLTQSSMQLPAMEALWEQCCSDNAVVRSSCCDALVLLVEQGHADLHCILNSTLNLLPTTRNVQGLIKVVGRLLLMQANQRRRGEPFISPYSIRSRPHPYITALENRVDCWPALLLEIDHIIQRAADREEQTYTTMLAPFLCYLYCEPKRLAQNALLRQSLLRVLLQSESKDPTSEVSTSLVLGLYQLLPYMQIDSVEAVLELTGFVEALLPTIIRNEHWRCERSQLALQLLCACQLSLKLSGECLPLLQILHQLVPHCGDELPLEEIMLGLALLLLQASAAQQTGCLRLALSLAPPEAENCPWGTFLLVMPLLQILSCSSLMEPLAEQHTHKLNYGLATSLLRSAQRVTHIPSEARVQLALPLSTWYSELQVAVRVLRMVAGDPTEASKWLQSVSSVVPLSQCVPKTLTVVLAYLIDTSKEEVCRLALKTAETIARADPTQVPSLLPILLLRLSKERNPSLAKAVLYSLPNFGTHKLCVPQVLHVLQILTSVPKLRVIAVRLMTALWEKQDRVYPSLQRLLGQQEKWIKLLGREAQWEHLLARATCLRDICRERPYQHGGDLLAAITHLIVQSPMPDQATPVALALQGLRELCSAEVVDIGSTWRALGPKLSLDTRPLVVKAIAELLSLVPQLTVKSEEYEKLQEQVVGFLWVYALNKDSDVASSGYKALSAFPNTAHTMSHLPEQVQEVKMLCKNETERETEVKETETEVSYIPGSCYIKLLGLNAASALPDFEVFLTSLVAQEMSQIPRGVYHASLQGENLHSDHGKTVAGIPAFLLKTYEKNQQPGLKSGLAAGLLLTYNLPVLKDGSGRPIKRFLLSRARSYRQMLTAFIHEVIIQPSDWHHALQLPQAWQGFMTRTFHAVYQGRQAELEMQQKSGKGNQEELQNELHCAWLWVRDQLTDVVKSASKDSPVVQGNCIFALSGLAAVLANFESNLPADRDRSMAVESQYIPTANWLAMVLNTLLSIISSSYKAREKVFPWFLHRSYSGENTASVIARSCACLALSLVVPVLVTWHKDSLAEVLATLRAGLPDSTSADDSQVVQFHSGLGLGMVLSCLLEKCFSNLSNQKMMDLLMSYIDPLDMCCFHPSLEYKTGCILGMGLVYAALSRSSLAIHRVRLTLALDRLLVGVQDSQGLVLQEVFAYAVACVCVSAFRSGHVDVNKAEEIMNTLCTVKEESQQTPGISLALGLVVHGLSICGHCKAEDIHSRLLAAWIKILLAEGCPIMQRMAAASGLVAIVGSESNLMKVNCESQLSPQLQRRLSDVIRSLTQIVLLSGTFGLQSNSACLMGHLHFAHMSSNHSYTSVPQNFAYLPEKSVIRYIVEFITEAGKKGPEMALSHEVKTALAPLASVGINFQYPPVNWSAILSPLMRLNFGEDVQHQCISLAVCQAQSSQSASLFLSEWIYPPLVHNLSCRTQTHLNSMLDVWMKHVSEDKLQVYLECLGLQQFKEDIRPQRMTVCLSLLSGIAKAMALPNIPKGCFSLLCATAEKIFLLLPNHIKENEVKLYEGISKCLSEFSDSEIRRITEITETSMEKTSFILARLTSLGRLPLPDLNYVISTVLLGFPRPRACWLLLQTFQGHLASSPNTDAMKRMHWLLDLMGHIRNAAYGAPAVKCEDTSEVADFLFHVFACAVVSWGDHSMPLLLGINAQWFQWHQRVKVPSSSHPLYLEQSFATNTLPLCLIGMPHSLRELLATEPWKGQSQKFIDWLFSITECPEQGISELSIKTAKAALLALKSSSEFAKKAVWTRACGW